jgi:hypothetical protein
MDSRGGIDHVLERDPVRRAVCDRPSGPARETVDRVPPFGLVEWKLIPVSVELVATVLDAIRPWNEQLSPTRRGNLGVPVAVDDRSLAEGVRP